MHSESSSDGPRTSGAAILGKFFRSNKLTPGAATEWMATLAGGTEIVVDDAQGGPRELGVVKAVSVVQSLAYLERRARQLLIAFIDNRDDWRLTTIDFGAEVARHDCEFLMCFVLDDPGTDTNIALAALYVEIGFALDLPLACDPEFRLTVKTIFRAPTAQK